jgi:hypothetical protein
MGHTGPEGNALGSWHPALRPDNDEPFQSSSPQPISQPVHDLDNYSVEPSLQGASVTDLDNGLPSLSNQSGRVPQNLDRGFENIPEEFDTQRPEGTESYQSPEDSSSAMPQTLEAENPAHDAASVTDAAAQGRLNLPVPDAAGQDNSSKDGFGLSLGHPAQQHVAQDESSEISSDEDDERLDPGWSVKRSDTEQLLAGVRRSSSFPTSPIDPNSEDAMSIDPLPSTQAEAVTTRTEVDVNPSKDIERPIEAFEQGISGNRALDGELFEQQEDSFFERIGSQNQISEEPTNAEARFEEGLPLVDSESRPNDELRGRDTPRGC